MQIMITHGSLARTRTLHLSRRRLVAILLAVTATFAALCVAAYDRLLSRSAVRDGWALPAARIAALPVQDEAGRHERFLRENLDAMAVRLGEMQAKLVRLEAMGERLAQLAGVKPEETRAIIGHANGGSGGPYVPPAQPTLQQLGAAFAAIDERADRDLDLYTLIESRLFEERLARLMIPNSRPVAGPVGSGFGVRSDPFSGRPALHTGLDFPADSGTPIHAAAGGVVLAGSVHPAYGRLLEIDHGNGLVTRYAHTSKIVVKAGDLVRRGQLVAHVGSTGRSTGPHLHFEVLVDGVQQDPAKFLAGGQAAARLLARQTRGVESAPLRSSRRTAPRRAAADPTGTPAAEAATQTPALPPPHVAQAPDPDLRQSQRPAAEAVPAGRSED